MGRYLLLNVEGGKFLAEGFRACQQLQAASDFAVLTGHHLLCIMSPGLRFLPLLKWQVPLEGIILVQRCASSQTLLVLWKMTMSADSTCYQAPSTHAASSLPFTLLAKANSRPRLLHASDCSGGILSVAASGCLTQQFEAAVFGPAVADEGCMPRNEAAVELLVLPPRLAVGTPGLLRKQPLIAPSSLPYHTATLPCQVSRAWKCSSPPCIGDVSWPCEPINRCVCSKLVMSCVWGCRTALVQRRFRWKFTPLTERAEQSEGCTYLRPQSSQGLLRLLPSQMLQAAWERISPRTPS